MKLTLYIILLVFFCTACQERAFLVYAEVEKNEIDGSIATDETEELEDIIDDYREELSETMDEVIALSSIDLNKSRVNGTLGLFVCDAAEIKTEEKFSTEIDFTVMNNGGLRINELRKGEITVGEIYELMPFDNTLSIVELDGKTVQMMVDKIVASGGWPVSSGIRITMDREKALQTLINGETLSADRTYRMLTNSYIADGGDYCNFLVERKQNRTPYMVRDAIIDYLRDLHSAGKTLEYHKEERIVRTYD